MKKERLIKRMIALASAVTIIGSASVALTGCSNIDENGETIPSRTAKYNIAENEYIINDGELHRGNMYLNAISYTSRGISSYYETDFDCGDNLKGNFEWTSSKSKPKADEYETICEDCFWPEQE